VSGGRSVNDLEHLFQPLTVGRMEVPNRIVMAPMERNYGQPDGTVSERTKAHYEARARGGVGWIDVESTFVHPSGRGRTHQLGLHDDACIPGFRELAELAHRHGAVIGVELHHAGRNTCRAVSGHEVVAPSPVPCPEAGPDVPRELTTGEIDELVEAYGQAARRAAEAGLDAVELHSAHGYLPLAFLSPLTNHRRDEYGGSLENRMRFALRVVEAFRRNVPDRTTVGCRFSASEFLPGGLTIDDTVEYARALEAAGVDYLSVSAGVYASFERIIPPMSEPAGWLLPLAAQVKAAVGIPVVGVSRFTDPRDADRAIGAGKVDLVAFGRAFLTDPDWPRKAQEGRLDEIVECVGCNQGCTARIAIQLDVTCLVSPQTGRERELAPKAAPRRKRVVVAGGGPAGLEAARVAAERGHDVVLYERGDLLGGELRLAGLLPHRGGWTRFADRAGERLRRAGVRVVLGRELDADELRRCSADVLVAACGARWVRPRLANGNGAVVDPAALLRQGAAPAGRAVVAGRGAVALGVAEWLAANGTPVSLVVPEPAVAEPLEQAGILGRLEETGLVRIHPEREVRRFADAAVTIGLTGAIGSLFEEELAPVATLVVAGERRPENALALAARQQGLAGEVLEIGDCESPRTAYEAVLEGALAGRSV
jgi:2,4-dienoyl-CoA reductase-like NADH-dependent reductase (Old Yellow Enzyme family)/thioredoxin reductase